MPRHRQEFSSQAEADLSKRMREIAKSQRGERSREAVLAHSRTSMERNRRLGELLASCRIVSLDESASGDDSR